MTRNAPARDHIREVFGDRVIATAILDRALHHSITINIRGNSYRLKDKLKAGQVRAEEPETVAQGGEFSMPTTGEIWMPLDTPASGPDCRTRK